MAYRDHFPAEYHPERWILFALESDRFVDDSWGNNVNPSWTRRNLTVWVAPARPEDREIPTDPRFWLEDRAMEHDPSAHITASDDLFALLALANRRDVPDWEET